jgi:insulysin
MSLSFRIGNLQTLKEVPESQGMNIRDMVVGFYHQYYSANQMRLVVYGKEPLDQLEQWVRDKFTAVPNQELPRPVFPSDPFSKSQLRRCAEVVPIKDVKALTIYFPVPEVSRWVGGHCTVYHYRTHAYDTDVDVEYNDDGW